MSGHRNLKADVNVTLGKQFCNISNLFYDLDIVKALHAAVTAYDHNVYKDVIDQALNNGVSPEHIADHIIPDTARLLGDDWCTDNVSFAEVTIGVSRLQSALRDLGPDWVSDHNADPSTPTIMVIVPQDVYHTLGAFVLAGQIRRKGISVRLMIGERPKEIAAKLQKTQTHAILISASCHEALEALRLLIKVIKSSVAKKTPVVIGGSVLDTEHDVRILTGADYVTSNLDKALEYCGLKMMPQGAKQNPHRI